MPFARRLTCPRRGFGELRRRDEALAYCQRALAVAPNDRRILDVYERLRSPEGAKDGMVQGSVKRVLRHADGYLYGFVVRDDGAGEVVFHLFLD